MRRERSGALTLLETMEDALLWGVRLAGLAVLAIVGYYLYAIFFQSEVLFRGASQGVPMPAAEYQRHLANIDSLSRVLMISVIVGMVCSFGRFYSFAETGVILLLLGVGLFYGVPYIIHTNGGSGSPPPALLKIGDPKRLLATNFAFAGLVLIAGSSTFLVGHIVYFLANAGKRRPRANEEAAKTANQVKKKQDQFLGPCWALPFCRDTDKELCPIRATKKPCWRTGRGCYCDQNIILTLSGGNVYQASRGSAGYMSRAAAIARPKSGSEKREQCLSCPVYLHHQSQKYRVLAPGVVLLVVLVLVLFWGTIQAGYPAVITSFGLAVSGFSFGSKAGEVPPWAKDMAETPGMMWMVLFVLTAIVVAYAVQAVEWALYRLGL